MSWWNKIFATLSGDGESGMVKLTPEEQQNYLDAAPEVFTPAPGAWGRQGCTMVKLKPAKVALVRQAVEAYCREVREGRFPESLHSFQ